MRTALALLRKPARVERQIKRKESVKDVLSQTPAKARIVSAHRETHATKPRTVASLRSGKKASLQQTFPSPRLPHCANEGSTISAHISPRKGTHAFPPSLLILPYPLPAWLLPSLLILPKLLPTSAPTLLPPPLDVGAKLAPPPTALIPLLSKLSQLLLSPAAVGQSAGGTNRSSNFSDFFAKTNLRRSVKAIKRARIPPPIMPSVTKVTFIAEVFLGSAARLAAVGEEEVEVERVEEREAAATVRREAGREEGVRVTMESVRVAVRRVLDSVDCVD